MKVAILGAGKMGGSLGACLHLGGAEVVLVDTFEEHVNKINEKGLLWQRNDEEPQSIKCRAFTSPANLEPCDVVICQTSGIYTDEVIKGAVGNLIGPSTYVATFQNGVGHTDTIKKYVSEDHILQGMLKLAGKLIEPGYIQTMIHPVCCIVVGSIHNEANANAMAMELADLFIAGGIISEFHEDIEYVIWEKVLNNCAFNSIASLARTNMRNVISGEHGRPILIACIKEVIEVANARNIPLDFEKALKFIDEQSLKNYGSHFPSMTFDIRAKRKTEIDFLNGAISRYGKELGIQTPVNDILAGLIKTMEDGYAYGF